jgi:hypothetical protein
VRRSTSNDILDQFGGELKFCTRWLHLSDSREFLYRHILDGRYCHAVGCTDRLKEEFLIPKKVERIAFVFTTGPNGGDLDTKVREYEFLDFTREARGEAGIGAHPERDWYWHVILDWED